MQVQLTVYLHQITGRIQERRDCSSHLSLTLCRKSRYTDVQITTCLKEYPWHRSAMHEMYWRCAVDAACTYTNRHTAPFQEYRAIALFQEHCHDYSRCRSGTGSNTTYERALARCTSFEIEATWIFRKNMTHTRSCITSVAHDNSRRHVLSDRRTPRAVHNRRYQSEKRWKKLLPVY